MSVHLFTVSEDAAAGVEANRVRLVSSGAPVSLTVNSSGGGGGGAVDSVNGQTGVVVLDAADVGAATAAQGTKADTAVQPGDLATVATTGAYADLIGEPTLATVATTGAYADLSGKPTLGTAAATAATDYATAAQGAKADTAVQPADLTPYATDADITALIGAAPAALDTLSELAAALGDDANFAATVTTALAGKQPLDADLTALAALTTTAYGRAFLELANQAALVALLPSYQPLDADLTTLAAAGNSATLAATTAAFTTADETKLDGIEAGADVTDAANVSAAGAVMKTLIDAKGDLIVGTAADTVARLAPGTDGHVLTADSAEASGVKWAAAAGGGSGADLEGWWVSPTISTTRRPLWPLGFHTHATTAAGWQNTRCYDFWLPHPMTLTAFVCEITVAGTGGTSSMVGIHNVNDAGTVGTRVTYQSFASDTTGVKTITDGTALPVGRYCVWFRIGPGGLTIREVNGRFAPSAAGSVTNLNGILARIGGNWADNTNPIPDSWASFAFANASDQPQAVALVLDR